MRSAFIPRNLEMTQFGDKAEKVALILDWIYRAKMYRNAYGQMKHGKDFTAPVMLNMEYLKTILRESATPILDLICNSKRHECNKTQPKKEVLIRVRSHKQGIQSASYILAKPYRVKPKVYRLQRLNNPIFKYDKAKMDEEIEGWSANYQTVCNNIKTLSLEMNEEQCNDLIARIRDRYTQNDQKMFIDHKTSALLNRNTKIDVEIAKNQAMTLWQQESKERIAQLDEQHYDSLLFIQDKFLEMEGKTEMPIYSLDEQGRLHYYLNRISFITF